MLSSIPTRILIIVFLWIAEAARPAVDSDGTTAQSRHRPAGHGGSHGSHHSRLTRQNHDKADLEDEAEEGAPDGDAQDPADSDAASASKNDSSTNTGFFQDLIQGHEQIKSAMEGYQDVVAKGEQRALDAYDKLGEFQSTIKNLTEPLRSLPIQVHELRQKMVNNFEAQTKELEAELRGATAELTEDSSVENPEKGDGNGNDGDELRLLRMTTPQKQIVKLRLLRMTTPQKQTVNLRLLRMTPATTMAARIRQMRNQLAKKMRMRRRLRLRLLRMMTQMWLIPAQALLLHNSPAHSSKCAVQKLLPAQACKWLLIDRSRQLTTCSHIIQLVDGSSSQ